VKKTPEFVLVTARKYPLTLAFMEHIKFIKIYFMYAYYIEGFIEAY